MRDRYEYYVLVRLLLASVLFLNACFSIVGSDSMNLKFKQKLSIQTSKKQIHFVVDIADTPEKRALGLMYQKSLARHHAMLFIFDSTDYHSIWMKNTFIPLDVIFLDENLRIVAIVPHAQPHSLETFNGNVPSRFVLEINAGLAAKFELAIGQKATLE